MPPQLRLWRRGRDGAGLWGGRRLGLEARGHRTIPASGPIGGGQIIWIDRERGVLAAGSDPRKDGSALGY